jgi:hypothetical protein
MITAVLLAGCAYDGLMVVQIEPGMTKKQVEHAQGKPDNVRVAGKYQALTYRKDDQQYHVVLENDKGIEFGRGTLSQYPGSDRFFID